MHTKTLIANWKMQLNFQEEIILAQQYKEYLEKYQSIEQSKNSQIIVAPSFLSLANIKKEFQNIKLSLSAQNVYSIPRGAFTGAISITMLKSLGIPYCIIGHSERRQYFNETEHTINKKIHLALKNNLCPILCIGEDINEYNNNKQYEVIESQLYKSLEQVKWKKNESFFFIVAYEPIWSIGTGETATFPKIEEMHTYIYNLLCKKYGETLAEHIPILYGGSVNAKNSASIFSCQHMDGALVGGASLKAEEFFTIFEILNSSH